MRLASLLLLHRPCHAVAAALHLGWGLAVSRGTLRLDGVYVPMPAATWRAMWAIAAATELEAGVLL